MFAPLYEANGLSRPSSAVDSCPSLGGGSVLRIENAADAICKLPASATRRKLPDMITQPNISIPADLKPWAMAAGKDAPEPDILAGITCVKS